MLKYLNFCYLFFVNLVTLTVHGQYVHFIGDHFFENTSKLNHPITDFLTDSQQPKANVQISLSDILKITPTDGDGFHFSHTDLLTSPKKIAETFSSCELGISSEVNHIGLLQCGTFRNPSKTLSPINALLLSGSHSKSLHDFPFFFINFFDSFLNEDNASENTQLIYPSSSFSAIHLPNHSYLGKLYGMTTSIAPGNKSTINKSTQPVSTPNSLQTNSQPLIHSESPFSSINNPDAISKIASTNGLKSSPYSFFNIFTPNAPFTSRVDSFSKGNQDQETFAQRSRNRRANMTNGTYFWEIVDFDSSSADNDNFYFTGNSSSNVITIEIAPLADGGTKGAGSDDTDPSSDPWGIPLNPSNAWQNGTTSFSLMTVNSTTNNIPISNITINSDAISYYLGNWWGHWDVTTAVNGSNTDYSLNYHFNYTGAPEPSTYFMTGALICFIGFNRNSRNSLLQLARIFKNKFWSYWSQYHFNSGKPS